METTVKVFKSPQFGEIRTTELKNNPYFSAHDVAKSLGYSNTRDAVGKHCKGVVKCDGVSKTTNQHGVTTEQVAEMSFIPESDVYRLIMRSKLPQAEQFQDWVCEEVLPSIRKNGGYIATQVEDNPETIMAKALLLADITIKKQANRLLESETKLKEQEPRVLFAQAVETSNKSCLVTELAKLICQNGVEIGQNRLFDWLRKNGYLCSKGESYNQPTQRSMDMLLFELKKTSITKPDGTVLVTTTTKVTGKGQVYFVNKFLGSKITI